MDIKKFSSKSTGKVIELSGIGALSHAFIPDPLPPAWDWPEQLWPLLLEARIALASLDGIGKYLPSPELLLHPLQIRESIRSSSLEGTYATPEQLLLFQIDPDYSDPDINAFREVNNYSLALQHYFSSANKLPVSLRLIRELHRILMTNVRGTDKQPGKFRTTQNQIGLPARYIPPPPNELNTCLSDLEHYIHTDSKYDPLVNAFIIHYQFEAIHPFLDGNGRVGRLLLSILIKEKCNLSNQWLYMSAYFESNKDEYINRLYKVSTHGDWEGWIEFCLKGVIDQAHDTEERCNRLIILSKEFKERVLAIRGSNRLNSIIDLLFVTPIVQVPYIRKKFDNIPYASAKADLEKLVKLEILKVDHGSKKLTYFSPEILSITNS